MRGLGEKIIENEVGLKLLQLTSTKFDAIISSTEKFQDVDSLNLDEVMDIMWPIS